jgi:simple sugar transport system permease protein
MMNYIAIAFTSYLVNYPFAVPGLANAMSPPIAPAIHLPRLLPPSQLHLGFVMALLCVLGVGVLFARTTWGFELSLHGMNPVFVRWAGIRAPRVILTAMGLSGFLGGLAGALQVLGIHYRFIANFSPGYGYDGIAIALLGRTTALGVLAGALLFGILRNGASGLELFAGIPLELVRILEAVIILLVTAESFMRWRTSKVKEA